MDKFIKKFIILICSSFLFFFLSLSFPTPSFAQQCITAPYQPSINTNLLDVCTEYSRSRGGNYFNPQCKAPSLVCDINPFCKKYSGQQCCTTNPKGGLGYDFCRQTAVTPDGSNFWKYTIQCCINPTPGPPTPTPTVW